jgi:transcriptional regulator with XRE-family HTH domain
MCQAESIKVSGAYQITGRQIAAARALLGLGQDELAARANISVPTLRRMEASEGPASGLPNNVLAVRGALEAGVIFVEENGEGPGVRLRKGKPALGSIPAEDLNASNDE